EAIRLCGTALIWFLSTPHRSLRDQATKALATIFTARIDALRRLIPLFGDVDDPYILERLIASAYGCALRAVDSAGVGKLAQDVYIWLFRDGNPPPHILLRDYARGIIEVALRLGVAQGIDLRRVRPPYRSDWPVTMPSEDAVRIYGDSSKDMNQDEWSRVHIYSSVMNHGDFSRYVIDPALRHWSTRRIGQVHPPSRETVYKSFVTSLTPRQRRVWKRYKQGRDNLVAAKLLRTLGTTDAVARNLRRRPMEEMGTAVETLEKKFIRLLGSEKRHRFT